MIRTASILCCENTLEELEMSNQKVAAIWDGVTDWTGAADAAGWSARPRRAAQAAERALTGTRTLRGGITYDRVDANQRNRMGNDSLHAG